MQKYSGTVDRDAYLRDGAIIIRDAFGDWLDILRSGFQRVEDNPGPYASENVATGEQGGFFDDYCNWQRIPEFQHFIYESSAADIAARAMGSERVQMFHEHILVKEPGTAKKTPWHQDMPYYCVEGRMTGSFWIPLDPVTKENTLQVVKGSHLWQKLVAPVSWADDSDFYDDMDEYMPMPDIDHGDYEIMLANLELGDALLFDYRAVHGAPGNPLMQRRRAFSLRMMGDDVRYRNRGKRHSPPFPDINLQDGDKMREDWFPYIL